MEANEKTVIKVKFNSTVDRLKFWNGPLGLSAKELEVLGALIDAEGDVCGTVNRRNAAAIVGMSKEVINTYIKRLKTKKALIYDGGLYRVAPIFEYRPRLEIIMYGGS